MATALIILITFLQNLQVFFRLIEVFTSSKKDNMCISLVPIFAFFKGCKRLASSNVYIWVPIIPQLVSRWSVVQETGKNAVRCAGNGERRKCAAWRGRGEL